VPKSKQQQFDAPRWLTSDEQVAWRSLLSVMVLLLDHLDRDLARDAGLSHAAYAVLANLSEAPERALRLSELAEILWTSRTRVTYLIDRLEKSGLVRREVVATDRRGIRAVLTDQGCAAVAQAAPFHIESVRQRVFDHLTPQQVGQLTAICQRLLPNLARPGASSVIDRIVGAEPK
jgi:DNA-binding MarR family transcriptional regulator